MKLEPRETITIERFARDVIDMRQREPERFSGPTPTHDLPILATKHGRHEGRPYFAYVQVGAEWLEEKAADLWEHLETCFDAQLESLVANTRHEEEGPST